MCFYANPLFKMAATSIYGKNTFKIFFSRTAKGIWTKFGMKHVGTMMIIFYILHNIIQYNLNGSKMDGSFTLDDSNSFFFQSLQNPSNSLRKQIFKDFFLFYHGIVCCMYSLEPPHRGNSNVYTQHTIIV